MKTIWVKNMLPEKEGHFWLWGTLWGAEDEKLYTIYCRKIANGHVCISEGNFVWESEIEGDYYVTYVIEPDVPNSPNSEIIGTEDAKFYPL